MDKGVGPAAIHCSAGIGRSGTVILVDSCLREAEMSGQGVVRIKQRLLDMRTYRMGLIQSEEQLRFSYQSIIEGIRQSGLRNSATVFETSAQEVSDSSSENGTLPSLKLGWFAGDPRNVDLLSRAKVVIAGVRPVSAPARRALESWAEPLALAG